MRGSVVLGPRLPCQHYWGTGGIKLLVTEEKKKTVNCQCFHDHAIIKFMCMSLSLKTNHSRCRVINPDTETVVTETNWNE